MNGRTIGSSRRRFASQVNRSTKNYFHAHIVVWWQYREVVDQVIRHNITKPPSSDGLRPEKRVHPQRKKGQRKPGGQPGHPGSYRRLLPTEQVQQVVPLRPSSCSQCGTKFHGQEPGEIILRHQVTDLPPVLAEVTEFQCWQVDCPWCGTRNRG